MINSAAYRDLRQLPAEDFRYPSSLISSTQRLTRLRTRTKTTKKFCQGRTTRFKMRLRWHCSGSYQPTKSSHQSFTIRAGGYHYTFFLLFLLLQAVITLWELIHHYSLLCSFKMIASCNHQHPRVGSVIVIAKDLDSNHSLKD